MLQPTGFGGSQLARSEPQQTKQELSKIHTAQIERDIKSLGAGMYDLLLPETHALPSIIHSDERIIGIVYGHYKKENGTQVGRGALVATSYRVLLLDKKPLFVRCDELIYRVVSGVSFSKAGIAGTVTLHTRMGDISIRTFNQRCANSFVGAVEAVIFKHTGKEI